MHPRKKAPPRHPLINERVAHRFDPSDLGTIVNCNDEGTRLNVVFDSKPNRFHPVVIDEVIVLSQQNKKPRPDYDD